MASCAENGRAVVGDYGAHITRSDAERRNSLYTSGWSWPAIAPVVENGKIQKCDGRAAGGYDPVDTPEAYHGLWVMD